MTPKISLILPVYNTEQNLNQTIGSICCQTLQDYEVILIGGPSTDHSLAVPRPAGQADDRFTFLSLPEVCEGLVRNAGLETAKGEYVIFAACGDRYEPEFFEKCYQKAILTRSDIVAWNFIGRDKRGKETRKTGIHTEWIPADCTVFSYQDCPINILRVTSADIRNKLYRRAFLLQSGLRFDALASCSDLAFVAATQAAAERISYATEYWMTCDLAAPFACAETKDVCAAVSGAVRFMNSLPHSESIKKAITKFVVENYINALKAGVSDFASREIAEFYNTVHNTFTGSLADLLPEDLHNGILYREYLTVKKHDYETMKRLISRRLIVSFTTYPARIHLIPQVLETVYKQTRKADEIVLWLAQEQFPGKETDLPESVRKLVEEKRLTLRWCEDLKPHKKYFYALQEYRNDLVVTIDDDLLYPSDMLSALHASYLLYPEAVSTLRAHLMLLDEENRILPYDSWIQETDACIHEPSMQLMATGGAGVLYPPGLFRREMFDAELIRKLCLWADDIWLKAMQLVSDVPVVLARKFEELKYLPGSQEDALQIRNVKQRQNDVQLENTIRWLDDAFEPGILVRKLTQEARGARILGVKSVTDHLNRERKRNRGMYLQTDAKLKQTENRLKTTERNRTQAEEKLADMQEQVRQLQQRAEKLEGKQEQLEQQLCRNAEQLLQREAQLRQCEEQLLQREALLLQRETQLRRTEQQLCETEDGWKQTAEKLREAEENAPIDRQLENLGIALRKQREAGEGIIRWGFKRFVYLLAWIPEKMLTGMMYYLHNGAKQTIKRIFRK